MNGSTRRQPMPHPDIARAHLDDIDAAQTALQTTAARHQEARRNLCAACDRAQRSGVTFPLIAAQIGMKTSSLRRIVAQYRRDLQQQEPT